MRIRETLAVWLRPAVYLGSNPVTAAGAILTTGSALTLICFWVLALFGHAALNPYFGIVFFLVLPAVFVLGLILIPLGVWWRHRKLSKRGALPNIYPRVDFARPAFRHGAALVGVATCLNVLILGTASYRSVTYMDSPMFCGQTCHNVMAPEYTAYQNSPHSRVECVSCHIGPGASWFMRSKLSGTPMVYMTILHDYPRPIPSPVTNLRPARETCEVCHWPGRFTGDKLLVRTSFADDEKNTPSTTVLLVKIGGRSWKGPIGIHGYHLGGRVSYIATDRARQVIPSVTYTDDSGKTSTFVSTDAKPSPQELERGEHRVMDCMDCHNRPTHAFQMPEEAVDERMADGRISLDLPFVKKEALEVLKKNYPDRATAGSQIVDAMVRFYRAQHPDIYSHDPGKVQDAAEQVKAIYLRNVFPEMGVLWGTYPNNIGHMDFPGCFRCHDNNHQAADGGAITQDCDACHSVLASDEPKPKILSELGLK
jgi:NapC/NirT cytochrome c family protein